MLRVFVDSGSSIKQEEKEKYGVEIAPLRYLIGETDYEDDIDLSLDEFYQKLIKEDLFPKTSLPNLDTLKEKVESFTNNGDEVIFLTISSGISGTYNAIKTLFEGNEKVAVVDTLSAVGGIRILVHEINKYRDKPLNFVVEKLNKLVPKIKILAIPETLMYLMKGGRLSKKDWLLGTMLKIKPVISIIKGKVEVVAKKIGIKNAMKYIVSALKSLRCDKTYPIVAAYTYNRKNVEELVNMTDEEFKPQIKEYDNLTPAIACHWGPNAFGYIFVGDEGLN